MKGLKTREAIVFDFDGVICKNFEEMTKLSAEILEYHFAKYGIHGEEAKSIAYDLYYKGYDLREFLQKRNPDITINEISRALNDFYKRAEEEVYNKCPISSTVISVIKKMYADYRNTIYISSLTSEKIINDFLKRHGIDKYIEKIYGHESGKKDAHFTCIKKNHPKARISFITDGVYDATQPANIIIGIVRGENRERSELFRKNAGENKECYILPSNIDIPVILQKLQILKDHSPECSSKIL